MRLLLAALVEKSADDQQARQRKLLLGLMVVLVEDRSARLLPLTKGLFAIVDSADLPSVSRKKWHTDKNNYAVSSIWFHRTKIQKKIKLHRFITSAPANLEVDHKSGNTLDNRRSNLRLCSRSENARNIDFKPANKNALGIKGVFFRKDRGKYRSVIWLNGKPKYCGTFNNPEDAARARLEMLVEIHGEFANFNDR